MDQRNTLNTPLALKAAALMIAILLLPLLVAAVVVGAFGWSLGKVGDLLMALAMGAVTGLRDMGLWTRRVRRKR